MAQAFFAPVLVTAVPADGQIVLRAINDTPSSQDVRVVMSAVNMAGEKRDLGSASATIGESAQDIATLSKTALGADELLHFEWATADNAAGSDIYAPRPYKDYDLQPPNLGAQINGNQITVKAQALALFVAVEADVAGRFDRNAFDLLLNEVATVTFTPADPHSTPTFTLRDLHSATYA